MKKFIRAKDFVIDERVSENEIINMDFVYSLFKQDWELKGFTRYDITFKTAHGTIGWCFVEENERDRVFNEIKEDFSYEI